MAHTVNENLLLTRPKFVKQGEYWEKKLSGGSENTGMPFTTSANNSVYGTITGDENRERVEIPISTHLAGRIIQLSKQSALSIYIIFLAGIKSLIHRYTHGNDIIIESPLYKFNLSDSTINDYLLVRDSVHGDLTFKELIVAVRQTLVEAYENQDYPFHRLQHTFRRNVVCIMENIHVAGAGEALNEKLVFSFLRDGGQLQGAISYHPAVHEKYYLEQAAGHLVHILEHGLFAVDTKISELPVLSPGERKQLLVDFNAKAARFRWDKTIHGLFAEQAARTPDSIAAVDGPGPGDGCARHLTYRALNEKAELLARHLRRLGIKENQIVGLLTERSIAMIAGILGILKAGGAYVPLDPKAPAARNRYILEECRAGVLVTTRLSVEEDKTIRSWDVEKVFLEMTGEGRGEVSPPPAERHAPCAPHPGSLAYVIFTSGSTGKPKGVPITHANLSPLLHWGYYHLDLGPSDRFLQNPPSYFDFSVWEIVMAFTTGAALYMTPDRIRFNPGRCVSFMNKHDITVLHITPTQYRFMADAESRQESLKYLVLGAERLPLELADRAFKSIADGCRVFNVYGPTECTIYAAVLELHRSNYRFNKFTTLSSTPIGIPVGNADLLVLDRYLQLSPLLTPGELYIAGDGVGAGYLSDPEKSASVFVENIYEARGITGRRLYKTGDLVRWLPDGNLEFLERIDHQVKIRGHRIELGEIENRLLTHREVKEAVVLDRNKENGDKYLCAYIVPHSPHSPHSTDLREY
ncbi:MAG: amino acid adenylation domain-containing protein, partial [bacterium]|nr:amino acid adenylation domain-containing protein [bacterium]